jgi:hypothetical protein
MDVRVQSQRLSPGVKHAEAAGLDLKPTVVQDSQVRWECGPRATLQDLCRVAREYRADRSAEASRYTQAPTLQKRLLA